MLGNFLDDLEPIENTIKNEVKNTKFDLKPIIYNFGDFLSEEPEIIHYSKKQKIEIIEKKQEEYKQNDFNFDVSLPSFDNKKLEEKDIKEKKQKEEEKEEDKKILDLPFCERYPPTRSCELIGNNESYKSLYRWLKIRINTYHNKLIKKVNPCMIISGNPGVGKTSAIKVVSLELKCELKIIDTNLLTSGTSLTSILEESLCCKKRKDVNPLIVVDGLDFILSINDEYTKVIKDKFFRKEISKQKYKEICKQRSLFSFLNCLTPSHPPLIFVINHRSHKTIRSIIPLCEQILWYKPSAMEIKDLLERLTFKKINIQMSVIIEIAQSCYGDIRKALNLIQFHSSKNTKNTKYINNIKTPDNYFNESSKILLWKLPTTNPIEGWNNFILNNKYYLPGHKTYNNKIIVESKIETIIENEPETYKGFFYENYIESILRTMPKKTLMNSLDIISNISDTLSEMEYLDQYSNLEESKLYMGQKVHNLMCKHRQKGDIHNDEKKKELNKNLINFPTIFTKENEWNINKKELRENTRQLLGFNMPVSDYNLSFQLLKEHISKLDTKDEKTWGKIFRELLSNDIDIETLKELSGLYEKNENEKNMKKVNHPWFKFLD